MYFVSPELPPLLPFHPLLLQLFSGCSLFSFVFPALHFFSLILLWIHTYAPLSRRLLSHGHSLSAAPGRIIYDRSCLLHTYTMRRQPKFFQRCTFLVDNFHMKGHVGKLFRWFSTLQDDTAFLFLASQHAVKDTPRACMLLTSRTRLSPSSGTGCSRPYLEAHGHAEMSFEDVLRALHVQRLRGGTRTSSKVL